MAAKFQESDERKERKINSATVKSLHSRSHKAWEHNYPTGKLLRDWYLVQQATKIDLRKKNLSLCCMEKQPIIMHCV